MSLLRATFGLHHSSQLYLVKRIDVEESTATTFVWSEAVHDTPAGRTCMPHMGVLGYSEATVIKRADPG